VMSKLVAAAVLLAALVRPAGAQLCPLEEAMHRLEDNNVHLKADLTEDRNRSFASWTSSVPKARRPQERSIISSNCDPALSNCR